MSHHYATSIDDIDLSGEANVHFVDNVSKDAYMKEWFGHWTRSALNTSCLVTAARVAFELTGQEPFTNWTPTTTVTATSDDPFVYIVTFGDEEEAQHGIPGEEHQLVVAQGKVVQSWWKEFTPVRQELPHDLDWDKINNCDLDELGKIVPNARREWQDTQQDLRILIFQHHLAV